MPRLTGADKGGARMPDEVEDAITSMLDTVAQAMTPRLQDTAEAHGWPAHVVEQLSVVHQDGALVPHYGGDQSEVDDLEYGGMDSAPSAAINNFFNSHEVKHDIAKTSTASMDVLWGRINGHFS